MNRHSPAQGFNSSLPVRQALFGTLALLMTLIGGQQYQYWTQAPEVLLKPQSHSITPAHFSPVSSQAGDAVLRPMDSVESVSDMPKQQRWVF